MGDGTSFLMAAYVVTAVVIVAYVAVLLRRLSKAGSRAEELGVDGSVVPAAPAADSLRSAAGTAASTVEPGWAAGEASRG